MINFIVKVAQIFGAYSANLMTTLRLMRLRFWYLWGDIGLLWSLTCGYTVSLHSLSLSLSLSLSHTHPHTHTQHRESERFSCSKQRYTHMWQQALKNVLINKLLSCSWISWPLDNVDWLRMCVRQNFFPSYLTRTQSQKMSKQHQKVPNLCNK